MTPEGWNEWVGLRLRSVLAQLPPAFREVTVEHEAIERWCDRVLAGQPGTLVLHGTTGTGKTGNAWAVWPRLIGLGWVGAWRATTELRYLDALLGDDAATSAAAQFADLLLLDDVGAAKVSDWSRSRLFALLDERWVARRSTILTTNLGPAALAAHLGDRATSRLGQDLTLVALTGPDRRTS